MIHRKHLFSGKQDQPFNEVFQFSDIAAELELGQMIDELVAQNFLQLITFIEFKAEGFR